MAIPTSPTLSSIVAEGLSKAGNKHPSSADTTRAETLWMEEIKNDIAQLAKRPRWLQITSHGILTKGQSRYSNPTDFGHDLSLVLLDGDVTGTAQNGSSNSLTLASNTNLTDSDLIGKDILITGNSGAASLSQCIAYDSSTKVASVAPNFTFSPAANSTYLIVNTEYPVNAGHVASIDQGRSIVRERPTSFSQIGDEDYGEFIFNCPPDKSYGARLRYYADIGRLDLTGSHIQTLYYKWRNLWVYGIAWKEYEDNDDSNEEKARSKYLNELNKLRANQYGLDLNAMSSRVVDFYG